MRKRNLLVKPLINDCMLGVWSDDSIQSINVIEGKLEELESLHHAYNELEATNKELYKENQDLRDRLNSEASYSWQLHQKYGVYKKAIEILRQFISLDLECNIIHEIRMGREMILISQQEYELLKEVLNND